MLRPPREVINTLVHTPGGRPCGRKGSALKGIAGNIDPLLRSCKLCTRLCKLFACVARVVTRCARRTCTRAFLHVLLANIAHYNAVAARSHSSFGVNKRKFELLRARTRSLSRISHLCCGCCDQSCGRMIPCVRKERVDKRASKLAPALDRWLNALHIVRGVLPIKHTEHRKRLDLRAID